MPVNVVRFLRGRGRLCLPPVRADMDIMKWALRGITERAPGGPAAAASAESVTDAYFHHHGDNSGGTGTRTAATGAPRASFPDPP